LFEWTASQCLVLLAVNIARVLHTVWVQIRCTLSTVSVDSRVQQCSHAINVITTSDIMKHMPCRCIRQLGLYVSYCKFGHFSECFMKSRLKWVQ